MPKYGDVALFGGFVVVMGLDPHITALIKRRRIFCFDGSHDVFQNLVWSRFLARYDSIDYSVFIKRNMCLG